ncbi:T9SS type A sorting domain-containing protein [Mucilaginibacter sp. UR6-1]|uniref:T9SS type A sorting domain-containing protein n=1 Tax=Mucilaginibacter sp. UR6-1 TaxID=1435643 RepID=UPI001E625405|nr:T9SS type A sorting domain-containing protein [Mucilaginibacter sp. UR6-1]MCC8409852.1 T9SS type A sorting domain-containing protein [Mucilaginibacter sp. UR6-1]
MNLCERSIYRIVKTIILLALLAFSVPVFAQTPAGRIETVSVSTNKNTGQNYASWLSDDLTSLVPEAWENNFVYADVMLRFKYHSRISQLKLYDYTGVFEDKPAEIYALNGTERTLLGYFTGPAYGIFQTIDLPAPVEADAIIVHKYSNNIPQKVFAYGEQDTTLATPASIELVAEQTGSTPATPTTPPVTEPTDSYVKLPLELSRWYQLNNVSDGLGGLFDGITETEVTTGWGKLFNNYDAYYPVPDGQRIDIAKIKFFNYTGALGDYPLTVSVIDSAGKRTAIGTYRGGYWNRWVGPYPERADQFTLDTIATNVKYIVLNCWYQFPTEIEFYGNYINTTSAPGSIPADTEAPATTAYPLKNFMGVNAFEWDFESPYDPFVVEAKRLSAMRTFSQVRHYMDWEKLESQQGGFTYAPTHSGGWNYDAMYKACYENNIMVLADLKTLPNWLLQSYPEGERDTENIPVKYGADYADPKSYLEQAKVAFQYAARYGSNKSVNKKLLSVNSSPRWTDDPINTVRVGLNYVKYIECDNERDKWWKGRKAYQTAYEYAANLSAFYDGHKNTMGPGVGVKNADPNMKVVMGGLASANPEYVMGMIQWCRINRGYKADGTVNLCWDVINYHWYSHDAEMIPNSVPTRGMAPEVNNTMQKARDFVELAKKYCYNMPVWVTEAGYDVNPYSPIRAIPIGNKTIEQTQADWILRTALLYARSGVERLFFYQAYDDNIDNPVQYSSSGLLTQNRTRKLAADYINQFNKVLGKYAYAESLSSSPVVDRYVLNGESAYIMYIPNEKGLTGKYTLNLPGIDSARVFTPQAGSLAVSKRKVTNGQFAVNISETPVFVMPVYKGDNTDTVSTSSLSKKVIMSVKQGIGNISQKPDTIAKAAAGYTINLFPNPSTQYVNVSFKNDSKTKVNISVADAISGRIYSNNDYAKADTDFSQTIDISKMPQGVCLVMIKQDEQTIVKRVIKTN